LQFAANTDIKETLYKSVDMIVLPGKEKLDMFRNLVGSGKVGNVRITSETAEVHFNQFPTHAVDFGGC